VTVFAASGVRIASMSDAVGARRSNLWGTKEESINQAALQLTNSRGVDDCRVPAISRSKVRFIVTCRVLQEHRILRPSIVEIG
jgi:hypothetical protein